MSRIVVIGMGVPSFVPWMHHAGPGLRTAHLASALAGAGHELLVVGVLREDEPPPPASAIAASPVPLELVRERELLSPAWRRRLDAFAADGVVGVTVYAAALAARLKIAAAGDAKAHGCLTAPLWADVFGDLMAEAQAKAARSGSDWSIVHFWTLMRSVLETADRFSAVSLAQSHALVGQLGLAGRLSARTAGEDFVSVIPCAVGVTAMPRERGAARRELGFGADDFVLLCSGGVNTWFDVETFCAGIAAAAGAEPRIKVLLTGGAIAGHDETSHAQLLAGLRSALGSRLVDLGWIDSGRLASVYAAADLALQVERPLYERRLGAENRMIEWLAHGLACVTTAQSESGRELVARGVAIGCTAGDAGSLAAAIVDAAHSRERDAGIGAEGRRWCREHRDFAQTAAPLLAWCAAPQTARDRDGARLVRVGLLSQPETSIEMLEAYVAALPLHELLRRGLRWIARRGLHWIARLRLHWIARLRLHWIARLRRDRLRAAAARVRSAAGLLRRARARSATGGKLMMLLLALCTAGCTRDGSRAGAVQPNVLLLSIDTLRADHVGAYGYGVKPSPTPWIDRLAARGVLFEQAITSAPETAPALGSLVTGVYQDRHGVGFNRESMNEDLRTLAERFKDAGYATASFVGNWLVDTKHGFGQGFDSVDVLFPGAAGTTTIDDRVVAMAGQWLSRRDPARPWLAWVHLMDPHGPYNSGSPWWSKEFDYAAVPPARDGVFEASESNFGLGVIPRYQKMAGLEKLSDYVRRYDGDIRYSDFQVGALLGMLAATGVSDDTIVVLMADHGESLVEHDELLQHGWFVYDTTVRVPLVVSWPAGLSEARRVSEQVCSVDVVPTLLELAGIDSDAADFDGRSLAHELGLADEPAAAGELRAPGCFSIGPRANHPFALRAGGIKTILTPAGAPTDPRAEKGARSEEPERLEVYDLKSDPGETADVASALVQSGDEMRQSITRLRSRFRANGFRW